MLVCSIPAADVVLVPRLPSAAQRDNLYFIAYATNVHAVELCEQLRSAKQAAVVLDIDNTLIDATSVSIPQADWDALEWIETTVETSSGRRIPGQFAHLPGFESDDPRQERAFIIHWKAGRIACTFKVRVRCGWGEFRQFLLRHDDRFRTFVCSKGKLEYVQLIWQGLDPGGRLIPRDAWYERITSTFPDTLARAAPKTALTALGCASITQPQEPTQLAAPVVCVDDSPEAYAPEYSNSLLYVEEFRPSDLVHADQGSVLRQVSARLDAYWSATCGEAGTFAWQAAQSFATAILGAMQRVPMESPDALAYLQVRCTKQGEALGRQITVAAVFDNNVYIADEDYSGDDAVMDEDGIAVKAPSPRSHLETVTAAMRPVVSENSFKEVQSILMPVRDDGATGAGGKADPDAMARTAEQLLNAALMMQC